MRYSVVKARIHLYLRCGWGAETDLLSWHCWILEAKMDMASALHTVLMDPIEHFMLGNSPFMRYPYTQYMRPSGTVLGTPE